MKNLDDVIVNKNGGINNHSGTENNKENAMNTTWSNDKDERTNEILQEGKMGTTPNDQSLILDGAIEGIKPMVPKSSLEYKNE